MFFLVSVIDCGRDVPLIALNSWSPRLCNLSGDNIGTSEEAGIKMATDEELGADIHYWVILKALE
jgi:hypothetical protein